jgi:hypothetical protein
LKKTVSRSPRPGAQVYASSAAPNESPLLPMSDPYAPQS